MRQAALAPPLLLAGLVTGTASLALHTRWWGLALGVAATAAALAALPPGWWTRPAFALGWVVPVLGVGLRTGPGGDVVVAADAAGYLLLVVALVVVVAALVSVPARRRRPPDESGSHPPSA